ncbi:MAG: hypothetical protein ACK515_17860 [bacterium]|jgi:hypothetical protein
MHYEGNVLITVQPSGEKFSFKVFKESQLEKLLEILRILEQSAKDEQALLEQQSQQADEENNNV